MLQVIFTLLLSAQVSGISWFYNPGCENQTLCANANMVHVVNSYQQYLWSSDAGLSGIVFGGINNLSINWTRYNDGESAPAVTVATDSSIGWRLRYLYLTDGTDNQTLQLTGEPWKRVQLPNTPADDLSFTYRNDYMSAKVLLNVSAGRMKVNPKLTYNVNSSVVDLMVNISRIPNLTVTKPTLAKIGIELASGNGFTVNNTRSFDDENTPALFKYDILVDSVAEGAYMVYRPVVYGDANRTKISVLTTGGVSPGSNAAGLLTKYYDTSSVKVVELEISPPNGKEEISKTFYWTISIGHGTPQSESISFACEILIFTIIGLPCAAMIIAGCLIMLKKRGAPPPGQGYTAI